jgi:hypothetical protein
MKLWRLLKIKSYSLKYKVPPFWPTYISERRTTFFKAYGIKVKYYLEFFGEHVRSLGTLCFDTPHPPNPQRKKGYPSFNDAT